MSVAEANRGHGRSSEHRRAAAHRGAPRRLSALLRREGVHRQPALGVLLLLLSLSRPRQNRLAAAHGTREQDGDQRVRPRWNRAGLSRLRGERGRRLVQRRAAPSLPDAQRRARAGCGNDRLDLLLHRRAGVPEQGDREVTSRRGVSRTASSRDARRRSETGEGGEERRREPPWPAVAVPLRRLLRGPGGRRRQPFSCGRAWASASTRGIRAGATRP